MTASNNDLKDNKQQYQNSNLKRDINNIPDYYKAWNQFDAVN